MIAPSSRDPPDYNPSIGHFEVAARVPTHPTPGRSLVTRRAVVDIVRSATLGSYGVTGFASDFARLLLGRLGLAHPGIRVAFDRPVVQEIGSLAPATPTIAIDLDLNVAYGVPVAEVARQVDSAVRYAIRRALDREVGRLTIHIDGLRYQPGDLPAPAPPHDPDAVGSDALAASGTDVA
jgi:uncharacterized alkaline shock family protein YloU